MNDSISYHQNNIFSPTNTNISLLKLEQAVLAIAGLETKSDIVPVSNSLAIVLDSDREAKIVQQLHFYLKNKKNGVSLKGFKWIYKTLKEWITDVLPTWTTWKLRVAIASLVAKGVLIREHLFAEHHGDNFHKKNRTYYYRLDYQRLDELAVEKLQTLENIRFAVDHKSGLRQTTEQICEVPQTRSENTSIENNQILDPPTTLRKCVRKKEKFTNEDFWTEPSNSSLAEEKVNLELQPTAKTREKSSRRVVQNKTKVIVEPPWRSPEEFNAFYRALVAALPKVADARSPHGLAKSIIKDLEAGKPHSYWDDWKAGLEIGTSTKPEWEFTPGTPYPMFVEYLAEKCKQPHDSPEKAYIAASNILSQPKLARSLWSQFKRSTVNVAQRIERDRELGVVTPSTPSWSVERSEPTIEEAAAAGEKIAAINDTARATLPPTKPTPSVESTSQPADDVTTLELRSANQEPASDDPWMNSSEIDEVEENLVPELKADNIESDAPPQPTLRELLLQKLGEHQLKGFSKQMPQVSQAEADREKRAEREPKTDIAQMSVAEINEYLSDPILRTEIMPQLWQSDRYHLEFDEEGVLIAVREMER